jgi:hypothetical protein
MLPLFLALSVTGCASLTPATWSSDVAKAQTAWTAAQPLINDIVAQKAPGATAAVQKAEATVTAELATLAASPAPVSTATLIADLAAVNAAIPPNTITPSEQTTISAALALAQVLSGL